MKQEEKTNVYLFLCDKYLLRLFAYKNMEWTNQSSQINCNSNQWTEMSLRFSVTPWRGCGWVTFDCYTSSRDRKKMCVKVHRSGMGVSASLLITIAPGSTLLSMQIIILL
jgi:hypothetical protein